MPNGYEQLGTSGRPPKLRFAGLVMGVGLLLSGCPEPTVSKSPDPSRAMGPVPSCVRNLPRSKTETGYVAQLPEKELWGLVVPAFQEGAVAPRPDTLGCNAEPIFDAEAFQGAEFDPSAIEEGRITYGGGANRLKVAWLRTHKAEGGLEAGPLVLIRTLEGHSEVYGIGAFRGEPEKSRFSLERLGGEIVVTAVSDGCAGVKPTETCDTELTVFRPNAGRLDPMAEIGLQRVRFAKGLEPGVSGQLRFQLVSSPAFEKDGIHVVEEVSVTDETGRNLRRAELEREFLLEGAEVSSTRESLWDRLYVSRVDSDAAKGSQIPATDPSEQAPPSSTPTQEPGAATSTGQ